LFFTVGDSGGFLLSPGKKLVGVVSEGLEDDADLGKFPTLFVKLSYFRDFLTKVLTG
jgi:secreted trypsin-like serine protease